MADEEAPGRVRQVVFDLDGVLTSKDSTITFVRRRLRRQPALLVRALPALLKYICASGAAARSEASIQLVDLALRGMTIEEVDAELSALAAEFVDDDWTHREAVDLLRQHAADGWDVTVNSATLAPFLVAFCAHLDLSTAHLVASEIGSRDGAVVMTRHNYGAAKMQHAGPPDSWDRAYTDSLSDAALLRAAADPVLVNPSARTLSRARTLISPSVRSVTWP